MASFFPGVSSPSMSGKVPLVLARYTVGPFVSKLCLVSLSFFSIYSYFGQAFVACVPTVPTAQILAAVFIGLNNFFSGLIVRPQYISGFFSIPYWITPGKFAG